MFCRYVGIRLLSLDGGGSRGMVEAMAIKKLELFLNHGSFHGGTESTNVHLYDVVDLIAGTDRPVLLQETLKLRNELTMP